MKKMISRMITYLNGRTSQYGIHIDELVEMRYLFRDSSNFRRGKHEYLRLSRSSKTGGMFPFASLEPKYVDHRKQSGAVDGHYFAQDLYVAQQLFMNSPKRHLDIGSRIDGFVSHVASFREIVVGDIRPATIKAKNIQFIRVDITDKSGIPNSSFDSVSCLHVLEHVGLGRYGDRIHPDGWLAAISNLVDIVTPGGRIYISVPVGRQKVAFNAHRIFDFSTIFEALSQLVLVDRLALVDDYQELHEFASNSAPAKDMADLQSYGCLVLSGTKHVKSKS